MKKRFKYLVQHNFFGNEPLIPVKEKDIKRVVIRDYVEEGSTRIYKWNKQYKKYFLLNYNELFFQ